MSDAFTTKEPYDSYKLHETHDTYESSCSTCYSENRLQKARVTVNKPICPYCKGTGVITRTEWAEVDGRDLDYDVTKPCVCQE